MLSENPHTNIIEGGFWDSIFTSIKQNSSTKKCKKVPLGAARAEASPKGSPKCGSPSFSRLTLPLFTQAVASKPQLSSLAPAHTYKYNKYPPF